MMVSLCHGAELMLEETESGGYYICADCMQPIVNQATLEIGDDENGNINGMD